MLSIIKTVALVLLALIFLMVLTTTLAIGAVDGKILDEDFYKDQLEENDFYVRVYTDVMPEIAAVPGYYGSLQISRQEAEELTTQIFPPEWLQAQVERSLDSLLPWLRSDSDGLDLTIDLRPAKERAHHAVTAFLAQKIDALPDCQTGQVLDLSAVSQGKFPECIPGGPDRNIIEGQLVSLATPIVDASIELAPDTLDLIDEAKSEDKTREQFLEDFDTPRRVIGNIVGIPQAAFYGAMAVVLGVIALSNLPRMKRVLRWLGGTMFFSGLTVVIISVVANSTAPRRVTEAIAENIEDAPAAINTLLSDIVSSGIKDLSMGFILPAAAIMGLGLLCLVLSFVSGSRHARTSGRTVPAN